MNARLSSVSWLAVGVLFGLLAFGCSQEKTKGGADKTGTVVDSTKSKSAPEKKSPAAANDGIPAEPIAAEKFPRPENAEKPMYTSDTNTVMFHQPGNVDDQTKFYTEQLEKLGWKKSDSSEVSDGVAFLDFNKGSLSITVTINPLREGMITTIAQGSGLSVPASLEEGDMDEDE